MRTKAWYLAATTAALLPLAACSSSGSEDGATATGQAGTTAATAAGSASDSPGTATSGPAASGAAASSPGASSPGASGPASTTDSATTPSAAASTPGAGAPDEPGDGCPPAEGAKKRTTVFRNPPQTCIDPAKTYTATVTTDAGPFTIALDAKKAPKTVNNFVFLARHKYYDGIVFHRVIKGFMTQGGDPDGTGAGGPGYPIPDELPQQGEYKIGSVAMANAGPNTNGSQFFIITGEDGAALAPSYSLFGEVTEGMDTVKKIEADGSDGDPEPPATTHKITSVTIAES